MWSARWGVVTPMPVLHLKFVVEPVIDKCSFPTGKSIYI